MEETIYDLVIIGGGPAGLTAGVYSSRLGLKTIILEKGITGGLLLDAPLIENYPGFKQIKGKDLAQKMKEHALLYVEVKELEEVKNLGRIGLLYKVLTNNKEYVCRGLVFATGTTHRRLGVKGEEEFLGRGVSYCATCDGFFFKGKRVAVIGGGNSGAVAALYLSGICEKVTVIELMPTMMCETAYQSKIKESGIEYILNSEITEIFGRNKVQGLIYRDRKTGKASSLDVDGVFIYAGLAPQSDLAKKLGVKTDQKGYILTDKHQRTNMLRVYAAGDVTGGPGQIITAAAQGAVSAISAFEDLKIK